MAQNGGLGASRALLGALLGVAWRALGPLLGPLQPSWAVLSGLGWLLGGSGPGLALTRGRRTYDPPPDPYLFIV